MISPVVSSANVSTIDTSVTRRLNEIASALLNIDDRVRKINAALLPPVPVGGPTDAPVRPDVRAITESLSSCEMSIDSITNRLTDIEHNL